ncbi:hypothetical protein KI387_038923, partial [Taxus chinensis]
MDETWTCGECTLCNDKDLNSCVGCGNPRPAVIGVRPYTTVMPASNTDAVRGAYHIHNQVEDGGGSGFCFPGLVAGAVSGALTGVFALAGAFTGAVTGALAGRASDSGLLRGAGLGAVAGAVLSVEVLEASRAYWYSERSRSRSSSSMADFIEELLNGRFVQEQVGPATLTAYHWQVLSSSQVRVAESSHEEIFEFFGEDGTQGLSGVSLEKLPWHPITEENKKDVYGENICCTICLQ